MVQDPQQEAFEALNGLADLELKDGTKLIDRPEYRPIADFVDERKRTIEDAIREKMCNSSWCSCRPNEIAKAVQNHIAAAALEL